MTPLEAAASELQSRNSSPPLHFFALCGEHCLSNFPKAVEMRQAALFAKSNLLYSGDNLRILKYRMADDFVDLIYLDPPFKSNKDYNVLFEERDGSRPAAQMKAFGDTWRWDAAAAESYRDVIENSPEHVSRTMQAFRDLLGGTDMLAYLAMMAPRLVEMQRVLKPTGSLFLHCDPTASHYLKLLLDSIFGPKNFRNEIIWHYFNKLQGNINRFPSNHDVIFWYSKTDDFVFNPLKETREKPVRQLKRVWDKKKQSIVNYKDPATGKTAYIVSSEKRVDDVWRMPMLQPASKEKLGFPTQKPLALLDRVLTACTNDGDTILDPFCGCGTTIEAAERLERRWIGIDITQVAIDTVMNRLETSYGPEIADTYTHIRDPESRADALRLAADDPYQFQFWVLDRLGAQEAPHKKGADKGIDGRLYFHDEPKGRTKLILISVKGGGTGPRHVRELQGVMERDKATMGVLVTIKEPTAAMRAEAISSGIYHSKTWNRDFPRFQIITAEQLIAGKRIDYPSAEWLYKPGFKEPVADVPQAKRTKSTPKRRRTMKTDV